MKISVYTKILPRLETFFIREWIEHTLSLGISEIFIYNNGFTIYDERYTKTDARDPIWKRKPNLDYFEDFSNVQISTELNRIVDSYNQVTLVSWEYGNDHNDSHIKSQVNGYKHCVKNNSSDYWLLCDPDEHFVLKKLLWEVELK